MSEITSCELCEMYEVHRAGWGPGPWQAEPHYLEFEHAGLPCILHRGGLGAWCGYVAVPPQHCCHGKSYDEVNELPTIWVHGGLTYSDPCDGHVCHVPKPGEPDNVWWLGFDCGHGGDGHPPFLGVAGGYKELPITHYWTMEEAKEETKRLAEQLTALQKSTIISSTPDNCLL